MAKRITKKRQEHEKICLECSKIVNIKKDHCVQLNTLNRAVSPNEYTTFHFQCWVDYFNKRVENKMRANVQFMQEKAMSLFNSPVIKQALSQIQGSEIALNMVRMPLNKPDLKEKIKEKLNHGKKRANRNKRKTQMQKM